MIRSHAEGLVIPRAAMGLLLCGALGGVVASVRLARAPVNALAVGPRLEVWPDGDWVPAHPPAASTSQRERGVLDLAWSGRAGPHSVVEARPRGLIVIVGRDGFVYLRGSLFRKGDLPGPDLGAALDHAATRGPVAAVLRIDRRATWDSVVEVVKAIRTALSSPEFLSFSVASRLPDERADGSIDLASAEIPSRQGDRIDVGMRFEDGAPDVTVGTTRARFESGDPYASGAIRERANAAWETIRAELVAARSRGADVVRFGLDPAISWAFGATALGFALDAGFPYVEFEGLGTFRMSSPPERRLDSLHGAHDPRDLPPIVPIGIGVALAGLFVVFSARSRPWRRRGA
jgi:hypothetical protein